MDSVAIRSAAEQRGTARETWKLLRLLRHERHRARSLALGKDLRDKLMKLYDIGIAEVERRLDEDIQPELRDLVQELVRAEDGVRLILHELSVGLLRGRERPPGPLEVPGVKIRAGGDNVMYRFEGEFWTDEIDDLVVTIPDRCLEQRITISQ